MAVMVVNHSRGRAPATKAMLLTALIAARAIRSAEVTRSDGADGRTTVQTSSTRGPMAGPRPPLAAISSATSKSALVTSPRLAGATAATALAAGLAIVTK